MLIDFNQTFIEFIKQAVRQKTISAPFPTDLNNNSLFLYILYSVAFRTPTKLVIRTIIHRFPQSHRRFPPRFHH